MKIIAVEPTPSPNTMKFTLSEALPQGKANNYNQDNLSDAPDFVKDIFAIEGVKGLYHVADFIAVDRHPKADWQTILPEVKSVFGEESEELETASIDEHFGEIQVQVQMFKDIPMQVKVTDGEEEHREALSPKFVDAVTSATKPEDNVVMQRKWVAQMPRYGDLTDVAKEVAEELEATYSMERLDQLVASAALPPEEQKTTRKWLKVTEEMLDVEDWKKRFALLEQMDPKLEDLPVLEKALKDVKPSIRRLAVVYLGMLESDEAIPYLEKAMEDKSVTVRRTAGDAFSDLGSKAGIDAMIKALEDKSKLVRWRAAMFLYELGDERALPALKQAEGDTEFEVSLQAKLASARIEKGEEAKGSVWKQMSEAFDKNE
ncbi:conserved virulence factor C family protein [Alkalicoccus daliensis]|uniref:PBS lyase HEAT-like repeat-containing protein n=1 Tax=Alkalicoccus daliensis TaxID=745820 RepID=A0A1H0ARB4_9BACI|nr:conserved virulence factor C family protein [Alkalicoccus daliensis]SDN35889.1 PBS lyase HEAT-like repeat-containing protein [Alkalicoccus daliensis]